VVLLLTAIVLALTGLHLRKAVRLGLAPLDQGWEPLELASRLLVRDAEGAFRVQLSGSTLELQTAALGRPNRLPAVGPVWHFDAEPYRTTYQVLDGHLIRTRHLSVGSPGLVQKLCPADNFEVELGPQANSLRFRLRSGKFQLVRRIYRWAR